MTRRHARDGRWLGIALIVFALGGGLVASGCGGGGGGGNSNGELCDQCGDTDGPCMPSVTVFGQDATDICGAEPCEVRLACFRKIDSSQRRCFPNNGDLASQQFECDGSRANRSTPTRTPTPTVTPLATVTPTTTGPTPSATGPTPTGPTPTPAGTTAALTPTPQPTATSADTCGNGVVDAGEDCDGTDLDGENCESVCLDSSGGTLRCNADCTFDTSGCVGDCS